MAKKKESSAEAEPKEAPIFGVLAEYSDPADLMEASKKVRDAGYERWDTYTPFPVHGIDPAMGIKRTRLPFIVLGAALTGLATAVWLQWWTNAVDYPWIVSGKPFWSVPANVPIMFELTVLLSAFAALGGMLVMNGLPHPSHPLDLNKRFARVTDDKFFLLIEAQDPKYDEAEVTKLLEGTHPDHIEPLPDDNQTQATLPKGIIYALIILTVAALLPFALSATMREQKSRDTRLHVVPDMDSQTKYKSQKVNDFFGDGRSMRAPVEGTIAIGHLRDDPHMYDGKVGDGWARTFPKEVKIDDATMARGKQQFNIYCAPCHGNGGKGDGIVHKRAMTKRVNAGADGWVPPANVTDEARANQPIGELYNTITNGKGNMSGYRSQVDVEDRWAIALYLRALQRGQNAQIADLTGEERSKVQ